MRHTLVSTLLLAFSTLGYATLKLPAKHGPPAVGQECTIEWDTKDIEGPIDMYLAPPDAEDTVGAIQIATAIPNTGSYKWTPDESVAGNPACLIISNNKKDKTEKHKKEHRSDQFTIITKPGHGRGKGHGKDKDKPKNEGKGKGKDKYYTDVPPGQGSCAPCSQSPPAHNPPTPGAPPIESSPPVQAPPQAQPPPPQMTYDTTLISMTTVPTIPPVSYTLVPTQPPVLAQPSGPAQPSVPNSPPIETQPPVQTPPPAQAPPVETSQPPPANETPITPSATSNVVSPPLFTGAAVQYIDSRSYMLVVGGIVTFFGLGLM